MGDMLTHENVMCKARTSTQLDKNVLWFLYVDRNRSWCSVVECIHFCTKWNANTNSFHVEMIFLLLYTNVKTELEYKYKKAGLTKHAVFILI